MYKKMILIIALLCAFSVYGQGSKYPAISEGLQVITGDSGSWDYNKAHTLSVVEANKEGYKYWGYYGLSYYGGDPSFRKAGLVFSNDLIHWEKYKGNPVIQQDCRWPTVVYVNSVFYMFFAEYDANNDSRIVMVSSSDGKHFDNKTEIVKREFGTQNQNPFIYFNKQDNCFYLYYYHGVETSNSKPLVGRLDIITKKPLETKNYWQIRCKKSKNINKLKDAKPTTMITSDYTIAAPSVTYYKGKYYLLVESIKEGSWDNKWVTLAYSSDKPDKGYKILANNPLLPDNDACAFQYVFDNQLYIYYSHCLDLNIWKWIIKMVKVL